MNKLNIEQIKQILPHRYPFLLIDRVEDYVAGQWAHAIKCVTANEQFFEGHFPGQAVMPGVLILEALAQTGAIALLSEPGMAGRIALFGGAKNVRFKRQVVPGDVLHLECKLTKRWGPIGQGEAKATVDGKLACQAEISFMLPDVAATPALSSAPSVSANSDVAPAQDTSTNTSASANTDQAVAHTAPAQDTSTNTNANDNSKDA